MQLLIRFILLIFLAQISFPALQAQPLLEKAEKLGEQRNQILKFHKFGLHRDPEVRAYPTVTEDDTIALDMLVRFLQNPWDKSIDPDLLDVDAYFTLYNAFVATRVSDKGFSGRSDLEASGIQAGAAPNPGISPFPQLTLTTQLIDGTARFIAQRFKEELALTFFDSFREHIRQSEWMGALLPATADLLLYQDPVQIPSMGQTVKAAFQNDLEGLLVNFQEYVYAHPEKYQKIIDDPRFQSLAAAAYVTSLTLRGYGVTEILQTLETRPEVMNSELGGAITLTNIFIEHLIASDTVYDNSEVKVINLPAFRKLETELSRKYFIALVYQYHKEHSDLLIHSDADFDRHFTSLNSLIQETIILVENVQEHREDLRVQISATENGKLSSEAVFEYAGFMFDALDLALRFRYFKSPESYRQSAFYQTGLPVGRRTIDVAKALNQEDYGMAMVGSLDIIGGMLSLLEVAAPTDSVDLLRNRQIDFVRRKMFFYGGFMVDILNAEDSKEIQQAIERVALPVGASRIKKNTLASISLNSYPGLCGGVEWIDSGGSFSDLGGVTGFTAPIGLALNFGGTKAIPDAEADFGDPRIYMDRNSNYRRLKGNSYSLFLSVVDIGAVVSFRLGNEVAPGLPENITFKQILSPGIFFAYGFRNAPISLVLGGQYSPELRTVTLDGISTNENALRLALNLAVDIPLLNFYSKRPVR